jgi:SAM-dependent methyltransferase
MKYDNFINIEFSVGNLDKYYIRNSIKKAIIENFQNFHGCLLDYGCGKMPYRHFLLNNTTISQYIGLDIEQALNYGDIKPDVTWDGLTIPFDNEYFDTVFATEVFEHIHDLDTALKEMYRVLKPGGVLFFTVPFLWPLHEAPYDEYRYTPYALEKKFKNACFTKIELFALGGWNASLAQMLGLWVRRKPFSNSTRRIFSWILKPVIKILIKRDIAPEKFTESMMITGCYGFITK